MKSLGGMGGRQGGRGSRAPYTVRAISGERNPWTVSMGITGGGTDWNQGCQSPADSSVTRRTSFGLLGAVIQ